MIKNLAQFKRALKLDSQWETTFHGGSEPKSMGIRSVSIKQSNAVAFETDSGTNSWLYFQPSKYYKFENNAVQVYSESGRVGDEKLNLILEYKAV